MNTFDPPKDYAEDDGMHDQHGIVAALDDTATHMGMTDREERKRLIKEAMREGFKEWLDEITLKFGRWSIRGLALAGFGALVYFILTHTGWVKP